MISGPIVVDASVIVEYLVRLRWLDAARAVFSAMAAGDVEMLAPDLVFLETVSALRKLASTRMIEARAATRAIGVLAQLPIRSMGTQHLLDDVWAWRENLTPYDAAYAALAMRMDLPVLTADGGLATALRRRSIRAVTLEELTD